MGQLTSLAPVAGAGRLIVTPHPVLLDGRTNTPADLLPGETLYAFLSRHIDLSEQWEVRVGGEVVPVEHWLRVRPKHGQHIEVVHAVNRQALMLVAMVALTYFTFGGGTIAGWGIGGTTAAGAFAAKATVYVAGSILINKVLGPKPPEPVSAVSRDSVHSITSARNQARPYDAVALLFGHTRITPDLASMPYIWHEGDDQYLGMVLNVGINVHDVGDIYHGEGLLSQFDGVQVYYNGIPGKPNQTIPLYSNADTIEGGELEKTTAWVQRTTPPNTRRIQLNIEGTIGDRTSKGKDYYNAETIQSEYRPVGSTTWLPLVSRVISNANGKNFEIQRVTLSRDVAEGQYDVRVRRLYTAQDVDKGDQYWSAQSQFQWTTMVAVQTDEATYAGMGRIGIRVRATGQLSGALDQLRMEAWSRPIPVWNGTAWVTEATSNPGALILQFLRGIHDENGRIIAGLGLDEDEIDIPSLQAFMVHCAANGYQYNHYLRDVRNNGDQLDAMARAGFGAMSWESGRWGVVWAADGQPVSGVVNMATIKKGQFQVDYTLAQSADGVEYTYLDSADWTAKTLRVPAPGVDVMLNPATVQAEGVSTEAHAAQMARWHLAQSLYQYKDIAFSTDLEHLAYKRMDVLQLQHDLTQWGYGGRLVAVDGSTLTLDEPVPGNSVAWIGVRVPGEAVYRTLRVQAFTGESDTITLLDPWPSDAPLPSASNPAHDYIWIYDFKATPGYRVRVVGKELESDAKGASVAVVPESPEFWNYVKTGEYIPPQPGSLLDTRPKASNVVVSEVQVITGDVVHTELAVTFDLKGPAARTVIFAGVQGSEIGPVAETVTQTARFRIGSAGTYTIVVRPYNADGIAGEAATVTYTTEGTDIPPPPFDWVSVTVEPSGLRRYAWGYHQYQPADLAGAEIRFMPGTVTNPDWETMTPLGADGFFTAAFESDVPAAGDWTFAFAAINTAGDLSAPVVTHVTLAENVGEHLQDHEDRIQSTEQLAQEILSDFADMAQQIDDVAAQAAADAAALNLRADQLRDDIDAEIGRATDAEAALGVRADQLRDDIDATMAQLNDILGAEEWDAGTAYVEGDLVQFDGKLYRAIQNVPAGTPTSNAAYWELIGDYASLGDAVAAALSQLSAHADELLAHAESLNLLGAKNGAGTAWMLNMDTVRVSASETMAQWRASLQADFGNVNARIDAEETARADGDSALATTLATVQATADNAATKAELTSAQSALAAADQALAEELRVLDVAVGPSKNLVQTPVFRGGLNDIGGWAHTASWLASVVAATGWLHPTESRVLRIEYSSTGTLLLDETGNGFPVVPGEVFNLQLDSRTSGFGSAGHYSFGIMFHDGLGNRVGWPGTSGDPITQGATWGTRSGRVVAPDGAASGTPVIRAVNPNVGGAIQATRFTIQRASAGERVNAGLIDMARVDIDAQGDQISAHTLQLQQQSADIEGKASTTYVQSVEGIATAAKDTADDAVAQASANLTSITGLQSTVGGQTARMDTLEQTHADDTAALTTAVQAVQATADNAATKAELTSAQSALAAADQALAEDIRVLDVAVGDTRNLVKNPTPRTTVDPWTGFNGVSSIQRVLGWLHPTEERVLRINLTGGTSTATAYEPEWHPVVADEVIVASMDARTIGFAGGDYYTLGCWFRDENGVQIGTSRQYSIGDIGSSGVWRTYQGRITVPAGAVEFRVAISAANPPADSAILAARISARRQSADGAILSSIVDIARADIQQNEDDIAAAVTRISAAETEIDGKASASDLAATQLTVSQQGTTLSAHGTQLSSLEADVLGHTASINEVREVSSQLLDGSVSINDPGFERQEWGGGVTGTSALPDGVTFNTASANQAGGLVSLRFGGVPGSSQRFVYSQRTIRVTPGQQIRFTLQSRSGSPMVAGDYVRLGGRLYEEGNPNGTNQSFSNTQRTSTGSSWGFSNGEASGIFTVPDKIVEIRPYVVAVVTDSQSIVVDDLKAELVSTDVASMLARYSLAVTAGGDVAGMQLLAGGGTSAIRFLADMFSVVDPGGGSRLEWSDGAIRVYDGSQMRVRLGRLS